MTGVALQTYRVRGRSGRCGWLVGWVFVVGTMALLSAAGAATASEAEWREQMRLARAAYVDERFEAARDGYEAAAAAAARIRPEGSAAGPQAVALANAAIARLDIGDLDAADATARRAMEIMDAAPRDAVAVGDQVEILEARGRIDLILSRFPAAYEVCAKGQTLADLHLAQHDRRRLLVESCIFQWEGYWLDAPNGPPDLDKWIRSAMAKETNVSPLERVSVLGPALAHQRVKERYSEAEELVQRLERGCEGHSGAILLGCRCEVQHQRISNYTARHARSDESSQVARLRGELDALQGACNFAFSGKWKYSSYVDNILLWTLIKQQEVTGANRQIEVMYGRDRQPLADIGFAHAIVALSFTTGDFRGARHWLSRWSELGESVYGQSHPKAAAIRREAAKLWDFLGENEAARALRRR